MVRPDRPDEPPPDAEGPHPSWAGAAGYHPADDIEPAAADPTGAEPERLGYQQVSEGMAAHAPLPGAPPYPALPPPELSPGRSTAEPTSSLQALAAAAVWLAVDLLLNLVLAGSAGVLAGAAACTLGVGLVLWLVLRKRALPFWQLVLVAAPLYWIVRLVLFPRAP
jgi:hypothetical protein